MCSDVAGCEMSTREGDRTKSEFWFGRPIPRNSLVDMERRGGISNAFSQCEHLHRSTDFFNQHLSGICFVYQSAHPTPNSSHERGRAAKSGFRADLVA